MVGWLLSIRERVVCKTVEPGSSPGRGATVRQAPGLLSFRTRAGPRPAGFFKTASPMLVVE